MSYMSEIKLLLALDPCLVVTIASGRRTAGRPRCHSRLWSQPAALRSCNRSHSHQHHTKNSSNNHHYTGHSRSSNTPQISHHQHHNLNSHENLHDRVPVCGIRVPVSGDAWGYYNCQLQGLFSSQCFSISVCGFPRTASLAGSHFDPQPNGPCSLLLLPQGAISSDIPPLSSLRHDRGCGKRGGFPRCWWPLRWSCGCGALGPRRGDGWHRAVAAISGYFCLVPECGEERS